MKKILKYFLLGLAILIFVEVICLITIRCHFLPCNAPSYKIESGKKTTFYKDINPYFGVWHQPDDSGWHSTGCFKVNYYSNSYGARDKQRQVKSDKPRVIMLGDSFIEGWGITEGKRLSDLLEKETGIEHLNFGMSFDFGPLQYYQVYHYLAKQFSHDAVMIGILPHNDFTDDDYVFGFNYYKNRYRPYLTGTYPDYSLVYYNPLNLVHTDTNSVSLKQWARTYTHFYNLYEYAVQRVKYELCYRQIDHTKRRKYNSRYFNYSEEEFKRMTWSLEKIIKEAKGKVIIFSIPTIIDFYDYIDYKKNPFGDEMKFFCDKNGVQYIDLLPLIFKNTENYKDCYFSCDQHWNEKGNEIVKELLLKEIDYKNLVKEK